MDAPAPIPLVDLRTNSAAVKADVLDAIGQIIDSAGYILGKEVELFEEEFAAYCGVRFAVGVANGTEALHMALRALDVGPGDEVITAGNSFAASAFAIAYAGADPVLVDVDETDFNIDPSLIEQAITPRTKAIIPVHLYGQTARMNEINAIAERHGLAVVEDAAQAHGCSTRENASVDWALWAVSVSTPARTSAPSVTGGAVVTNDPDLAERLRLLRNYGQVQKNQHAMLGYNCRLDSVQAAVLLVKLRYLEEWTASRRRAAARYRQLLAGSEVITPLERSDVSHVYHLFVVRHPRRDEIMQALAAKNISCGIHYPHPLSHAAPFRNSPTVPAGLPVCSRITREILSLPMYPELTDQQIERVVEELVAVTALTPA